MKYTHSLRDVANPPIAFSSRFFTLENKAREISVPLRHFTHTKLLSILRHGDGTVTSGYKHAHIVSVKKNLFELSDAVATLRVDLRQDASVRSLCASGG